MKTAIIHDWLVVYGGAERVLEQMLAVYPEADLYSLIDFIPEKEREFIHNKEVVTSFLQKMPLVRSKYRNYLQLMPLAIEQFDFRGYDLIISSSSAVAKGVLTGPDQLHVCMCYSPVRYAWDLQNQYLEETGLNKGLKGLYTRKVLHDLRQWDFRSAYSVDHFIAISRYIARRIKKVYRRESVVIYPPVDVHSFTLNREKDSFYLAVSRLVPYKKMALLAEAFSKMPSKRLVIIGDGPDLKKVMAKAGPNVKILGYRPFAEVMQYMQKAKALVFAALEDFGIVVLEAQACGTPVIAFGQGGALETVNGQSSECQTGIFFQEQSIESIIKAVEEFEEIGRTIKPENCRDNALRFSAQRFRNEFKNYIDTIYASFIDSK